MDRVRVTVMAVLACAAALVAGEACAQARGPTVKEVLGDPVDPVVAGSATLAELRTWLGRLPGRYRLIGRDYDGLAIPDSFKTIMDCVGIGSGPGVQCMSAGLPVEGGPLHFDGMTLYGLDPDEQSIRTLTVGSTSIAQTSLGRLVSDKLSSTGNCPRSTSTNVVRLACNFETQINIPPDSGHLEMRALMEQRLMPVVVVQGGGGAVAHRSSTVITSIMSSRWERLPPPAGESLAVVAQSPPVAPQPADDLQEVLAAGQQQLGNRDDIESWLRRLAGRFRIEGTLERSVDSLLVAGTADCLSVGQGPGMNCVIRLEAPNIDTHLKPGAFILGIDLETRTVRYTSVDDTGVGVGATASLWGDTAVFRTPCKASFARTCTTTTRISAAQDSDSVRLRIEINMDGRATASYDVREVRIK